jgi:hypothetical protein
VSLGGTVRLLASPCLACNREAWQPMCDLCSDLVDAEETADNERRDDDDD